MYIKGRFNPFVCPGVYTASSKPASVGRDAVDKRTPLLNIVKLVHRSPKVIHLGAVLLIMLLVPTSP